MGSAEESGEISRPSNSSMEGREILMDCKDLSLHRARHRSGVS